MTVLPPTQPPLPIGALVTILYNNNVRTFAGEKKYTSHGETGTTGKPVYAGVGVIGEILNIKMYAGGRGIGIVERVGKTARLRVVRKTHGGAFVRLWGTSHENRGA